MSKLDRCIDCGKEYKFDYSEINPNIDPSNDIQFTKMIKDYKSTLNFPEETNICLPCLKSIMTKKNNSTQNNPEQKNTQTPQEYIEKIKQNFSKDENDLKKFDETEEKKQIEELNKLKGEVEKDELELNSLLNELEKMEKEESKFCSEFRDLEIKLYFEEINKMKNSELINNYKNKINKINTNNIFSELFQISFSEKFGTINGCKFCDPYISNNYDSINGGWGYIILLTKLLSIKYMFESSKYDLIPEGNFSKISNKIGIGEYEVGISDMNRTMEKFNKAMEVYLDYLNEFLNYLIKEGKIEQKGEDICPKINGNKINKKCIQIEEGKDKVLDNWYQCMKYLLTILKFLICQTLKNEDNSYN